MQVSITLLLGLPLALGHAIALLRRRARVSRVDRQVLVYIAVTIVFASVVVNALEANENQRFRFELDGMYTILVGVLISRLWDRFARRR